MTQAAAKAAFEDEMEKIAGLGQRAASFFRGTPRNVAVSAKEAPELLRSLGLSRHLPGTRARGQAKQIKKSLAGGQAARWARARQSITSGDPGKRRAAAKEMQALRRENSPVLRGIDRLKKRTAPKPPEPSVGTKAKLVGGGAGLGAAGLVGAQLYAKSQDPYRGY